jgi:hypothetical protein
MNYSPHILTAKVNLSGIPKGSRLVYASDANDYLTYQHGSRPLSNADHSACPDARQSRFR